MTTQLDVKNFETFSEDEYRSNLERLGIKLHADLVGIKVYYSDYAYGKHEVLKWNEETGMYLLQIDDNKFWSNPFRIK